MTTHIQTAPRRKPRHSSGRTAGRAPRPAVLVCDPPHEGSLTALAVEAMRAGVVAGCVLRPPHAPEEGLAPMPDQNEVDEIGRLYGVQEEDSGELRTSSELMSRRDRRRFELCPCSRRSRI